MPVNAPTFSQHFGSPSSFVDPSHLLSLVELRFTQTQILPSRANPFARIHVPQDPHFDRSEPYSRE